MVESPTQPASSLSGTKWKSIRPVKYGNYLKTVTSKGSLSPFDDSKLNISWIYTNDHFT